MGREEKGLADQRTREGKLHISVSEVRSGAMVAEHPGPGGRKWRRGLDERGQCVFSRVPKLEVRTGGFQFKREKDWSLQSLSLLVNQTK